MFSKNLHCRFDISVKATVNIFSILEAFLENMNFSFIPKIGPFTYSFSKLIVLPFQATDTMEDLKRKIKSQKGIDPQRISFGWKSLSWKCPQCKAADNRSLDEFEEFRKAFGPSEKLIMQSEDQKKDEFRVSAPVPIENYVKSKGPKLSYVTIKQMTGKALKISVKVSQTTKIYL